MSFDDDGRDLRLGRSSPCLQAGQAEQRQPGIEQTIQEFGPQLEENLAELAQELKDRQAIDPNRYDGYWFLSPEARKSGRWESQQSGTGWYRPRYSNVLDPSLRPASPTTVMDFGPTRLPACLTTLWTPCSSQVTASWWMRISRSS